MSYFKRSFLDDGQALNAATNKLDYENLLL
jgi:hypothetical protein